MTVCLVIIQRNVQYTPIQLRHYTLKTDIKNWLNNNDNIKGDAMIIQDDMKPEMRFKSTEMFTTSAEDRNY